MADIGLAWVSAAPFIKPADVTDFARKVESMGAHSMWAIDRIAFDNLEALTLLAAAAGVTRRIRLGTSVLLANTRHPTHLAKIVATLDFLSNGRFTLGVGFGSRESDYKAVEVPFEHRGSRAVEMLELMKRLWREDNVTFRGRFFNVENLSLGPKPVQQPHPPIWTGGTAEASLKRAGTWADGYMAGAAGITGFRGLWDKISGYASAAGRDPSKIARSGLAFMAIDDDKSKAIEAIESFTIRYYGAVRTPVEPISIVGSPAECADKIRSFIDHGLQTLILGVVNPDPRQVDIFGEKVLPLLR